MSPDTSKETEAAPKATVVITAAEHTEPSVVGAEEGRAVATPKKHIGGAYKSILLAAGVPCLVVFLISGLLMAEVLGGVVGTGTSHPELQPRPTPTATTTSSAFSALSDFHQSGGSDVYWINFNPTSLTTIAAWTGKLIPYLSSAMMGLAAFFVADHIREASRKSQNDKLLTPQQMALMLGLLAGGWGHLWDVVRYRARPGNKLEGPIPIAIAALLFTTILG